MGLVAALLSVEVYRRITGILWRRILLVLLLKNLQARPSLDQRPSNIVDGGIEIRYGKTKSARRRIPMTPRVKEIFEMRAERSRGSKWIFPALTKSGHIEKSSLRKQHATALKEASRLLREQTGSKTVQFENFDLYSLRHTCLTRWAPHMDPWTLMRMAGHCDMATTMRYIHPEEEPTRNAMQRARDAVDRRAKEAVERARRELEQAQGRDSIRDSDVYQIASLNPRGKAN